MPQGRFVNINVSSLARELHMANSTVSIKLKAGMTPDQIREHARVRTAKIKAGVPVSGSMTPEMRKATGALTAGDVLKKMQMQEDEQSDIDRLAGRPPAKQLELDGLRRRFKVAPIPGSIDPAVEQLVDTVAVKPNGKANGRAAGMSAMSPVTREIEVLAEAQRRKETALADKAELDVLQRRGELVPLATANAWFAGAVVKARDILLRIGPELRDRLAVETDPIRVEAMVVEEVVRALSMLKELEV